MAASEHLVVVEEGNTNRSLSNVTFESARGLNWWNEFGRMALYSKCRPDLNSQNNPEIILVLESKADRDKLVRVIPFPQPEGEALVAWVYLVNWLNGHGIHIESMHELSCKSHDITDSFPLISIKGKYSHFSCRTFLNRRRLMEVHPHHVWFTEAGETISKYSLPAVEDYIYRHFHKPNAVLSEALDNFRRAHRAVVSMLRTEDPNWKAMAKIGLRSELGNLYALRARMAPLAQELRI